MMKKLWVKLLIFILLPTGMFIVGELYAANIYDIKVSDDLTGAEQIQPRVAVGYSGEIAVVWADKRNGYSSIYYQYLDSAGNAAGLNRKMGGLSVTAPQYEPSLNANLMGRFASVWRDYRNGSYPFAPDIYYAAMDTSGAGINNVITEIRSDSTCQAPDIAVLPNGDIIAVWADYRNHNWDIYAQRFNSSGGAIGVNFKVNYDSGIYQQHSPRVAGLSNGGFVVVWYDNRSGNDDIYGQRFDVSGNALGNNFKISDDQSGKRQAWPAVSADGNGRFFVAWVDWRNGSYPDNPDIYFRRYNSSGAAIDISRRINPEDDNSSSQRDVALCSDRMGNLGIVWADSSTGQWNAVGRIVDSEGEITDDMFQLHQDTGGRQRQPDIATDGYKFYFVWSDDRNGNFDIYLTIKDYNDPSITASPNSLSFLMEDDGALPPSQTIALSNAGYGELHWETRTSVDWITVTPDSGMTPAEISVSINSDTLAYGDYVGEIRLINLDQDDSTEVVPVALSVRSPILEVSPDTVSFRVLAELGNPGSRSIQIRNTGIGNMSWYAEKNTSWFDLASSGGTAPDDAEINVDVSGLPYGEYIDPVLIYSEEAVNSPDTVWVSLSLAGNMPFLAPVPETLNLYGNLTETISGTIQILNPGSGTLDWNVVNNIPWLDLDITGGSDNDIINVEVLSGFLGSGIHTGELYFYDSASFNIDTIVPVNLYLSSSDTVIFQNGNTMPGGIGVIPISMTLSNPATEIYIPIGFNSSLATLDSVVFDETSFDDNIIAGDIIGEGFAEISIYSDTSIVGDLTIAPGDYDFALLYFTAADTDAICPVDTVSSDTSSLYVKNGLFQKSVPALVPGRLFIGNPTAIDESASDVSLPGSFELFQNYPNPFNGTTRIELNIPRGESGRLVVYNILGQEASLIFDGYLPAGRQVFSWDGRLNSGVPAPTGIYFYRFESKSYTAVKKMLLLK